MNRSTLCFASSVPSTLGKSRAWIRLTRDTVEAAASFSLARVTAAGSSVSSRDFDFGLDLLAVEDARTDLVEAWLDEQRRVSSQC